MTKIEAENLLLNLVSCQHALDKVLVIAENLSVEKEKDAIKKVVLDVVGEILTEAIVPIIHQHPELDPYKD